MNWATFIGRGTINSGDNGRRQMCYDRDEPWKQYTEQERSWHNKKVLINSIFGTFPNR